jgi:hypothetical protein
MGIDQQFNFGKYKGYTLKEVYQGTNAVKSELIEEFLNYQLKSSKHLSLLTSDELIFIDTQNIVVADGKIYTKPEQDLYRGDWSKAFEKLFRNRNSIKDRKVGFIGLNDFNKKIFSSNKSKVALASANPYYIKWCIETLDDFFILPEDIKLLEKLTTYSYAGIKVVFKTSDCFEYRPFFSEQKYSFSLETLMINEKNRIEANKPNSRNVRFKLDVNEDTDTFTSFANSYAQDVEGYSDQEINEIFGGERDAYWNID